MKRTKDHYFAQPYNILQGGKFPTPNHDSRAKVHCFWTLTQQRGVVLTLTYKCIPQNGDNVALIISMDHHTF